MDKELSILILEDNEADIALVQEELLGAGIAFQLKKSSSKEEFTKLLEEGAPDIILSDYNLPSFDGLKALGLAKGKYPDVPFVFLSGAIGEEFAIETLKKGATDYVLKNNLPRLIPVVKRALQEFEQLVERRRVQEDLIRREYQLEVLTRTSRHINAVLDVPTIIQTLISAAMELVGATGGMAGLVKEDTLVYEEYNKAGKWQEINYLVPLQGGIENIRETVRSYISNDAANDERIPAEKQKQFELYNLVNVPIINGRGQIIGCFEMHNKEARKPFDSQDAFMLQGMSASAAIALENAWMLIEQKALHQEILKTNQSLQRQINRAAKHFPTKKKLE